MRNKTITTLAIVIFILSLPLLPIELIFGYWSNLIRRIKQNFQIILFSVAMGKSKNSNIVKEVIPPLFVPICKKY
jgi:hypothetical protein